jgi:hypothetical protein
MSLTPHPPVPTRLQNVSGTEKNYRAPTQGQQRIFTPVANSDKIENIAGKSELINKSIRQLATKINHQ